MSQELANKQLEALRSMYDFHALLVNMSEDEVKIFCENNRRLIQNLIDQLSY